MPNVIRKIHEMLIHLRGAEGLSRKDTIPIAPMAIGNLTVTCRTTWPTDYAAWEALSRQFPYSTTFHAAAWQIASWTAGRIRGRLRFLQVHRADGLLAVLPLCLNDAGGLHSPGASISDYLDPLIVPEAEADCWQAVLSFLRVQWDRKLVELTLHNVREEAPCRRHLPSLAEANGFHFSEKIVEHAPAILLPTTWEMFLDSLDPHERKEIRRKLNKVETKGDARLLRCESESDIAAILPRVIGMMEAAGGEKGLAVKQYLAPLLIATASGLIREGRLELYALYIKGELASGLIQFPSASGPMLYNFGYESAMKEWSPGVVAVAMSIRNAISARATVFDLLRGREPYKYKLGAVDRPLYRLTLKGR